MALNIYCRIPLYSIIYSSCILYLSQSLPYDRIPPGHADEMFAEIKHYDELFFVKRSYAEFIQGMKERKQINSSKVEELFHKVRRADFSNRRPVHGFCNIPYGFDYQVIMEMPSYVALVLEHLVDYIKNGSRVLEIGSGQGFITACLGHLVGSAGKVYGLEHIESIANGSLRNIKISCPELLQKKIVEIVVKDGRWGHPEEGPYDVIFFGGAVPEVSKTILAQMKPYGRIIAPVGNVWRQNLSVIDTRPDGSYSSHIIKRVSADYLWDLYFQMYPERATYRSNESNEGYETVFPPTTAWPPGIRYFPHPFDWTLGTGTPTGPYPEMYVDDSVDERRLYPQKVLDAWYGPNKTKSLHR